MAKGLRKTIILNPDNPKEKAILDVLDKQYNYAEFIRNVLYQHISNNNILHDDDSITIPLSYHDNTMTTPLPCNDNTITIPLSCDGNDNKSDFFVNLNELDDSNVSINASDEENPSQNALDFLKNSF